MACSLFLSNSLSLFKVPEKRLNMFKSYVRRTTSDDGKTPDSNRSPEYFRCLKKRFILGDIHVIYW